MRRIVWGIFIFVSFTLKAQEKYYSEPLKIPILLTGSFAELRTNHFHSGIDIRTEGRTGVPVYPTAIGYISRIVVSPFGFGNALYIDHPNGTTSLYGHLERFNDSISEYIKNIQYKNESFSIDESVPIGKFQVSKNEIVAFSGNTGSSGGPHLHFEIRDTESQETLNPLEYNFNIKDDISPKITGLRIYPLNNQSHVAYSGKNKSYEIVFYNGKYHIKNNPVVPVFGNIGFGIQSYDYFNGTFSKCGINYLSLKIDRAEYFSFKLKKFAFSDTRYINSLIDYETLITRQKWYYKTWKEPGARLDIFNVRNEDGSYEANDSLAHIVEIIIKDSYNNESILEFKIKSDYRKLASVEKQSAQDFYYNRANSFESPGLNLNCPKGSFYTSFGFDYNVIPNSSDSTLFSDIHELHYNTTPVHIPLTLSIKTGKFPEELADKALIVSLNKDNGSRTSVGGTYENGYVSTEIRSFGNYAVAVDKRPPTIESLSLKNKNSLIEPNQIRFKIRDSLSGIKKYRGTIDGQWVLFEYDAKNNLISYKFDKKRMAFNKSHKLNMIATDNKGNSATYEASFFK